MTEKRSFNLRASWILYHRLHPAQWTKTFDFVLAQKLAYKRSVTALLGWLQANFHLRPETLRQVDEGRVGHDRWTTHPGRLRRHIKVKAHPWRQAGRLHHHPQALAEKVIGERFRECCVLWAHDGLPCHQCQVWPLFQVYSVNFLQSRIILIKYH